MTRFNSGIITAIILIGSLLSDIDAICPPYHGICPDCSDAIDDTCNVRVCNSSGCIVSEECITTPVRKQACVKFQVTGAPPFGLSPLSFVTCDLEERNRKCRRGRSWIRGNNNI
ncbi:unnamed protein product [Orchesella dallaii]|uniref:Uncharacterized protein n=1 Tax=Orchesella dallaii TaxID=48710 RepID=A0ABP1RM89_9HEXA